MAHYHKYADILTMMITIILFSSFLIAGDIRAAGGGGWLLVQHPGAAPEPRQARPHQLHPRELPPRVLPHRDLGPRARLQDTAGIIGSGEIEFSLSD